MESLTYITALTIKDNSRVEDDGNAQQQNQENDNCVRKDKDQVIDCINDIKGIQNDLKDTDTNTDINNYHDNLNTKFICVSTDDTNYITVNSKEREDRNDRGGVKELENYYLTPTKLENDSGKNSPTKCVNVKEKNYVEILDDNNTDGGNEHDQKLQTNQTNALTPSNSNANEGSVKKHSYINDSTLVRSKEHENYYLTPTILDDNNTEGGNEHDQQLQANQTNALSPSNSNANDESVKKHSYINNSTLARSTYVKEEKDNINKEKNRYTKLLTNVPNSTNGMENMIQEVNNIEENVAQVNGAIVGQTGENNNATLDTFGTEMDQRGPLPEIPYDIISLKSHEENNSSEKNNKLKYLIALIAVIIAILIIVLGVGIHFAMIPNQGRTYVAGLMKLRNGQNVTADMIKELNQTIHECLVKSESFKENIVSVSVTIVSPTIKSSLYYVMALTMDGKYNLDKMYRYISQDCLFGKSATLGSLVCIGVVSKFDLTTVNKLPCNEKI